MTHGLHLGIDVGGTKIAALVADASRVVLGRSQVATDVTSPERTLDGIADAVHQALAQVPAALGDVAAIGLGIPGRVRADTGWVESAVNLRWRRLPVGPRLSERFGVPCFLENDARAAALGAHQSAIERQYQNWAYISVGTGIAAGIILGGQLYRGPNGMAGEIGHIRAAPEGLACACGLCGCLETLASGPAIARQARALGMGSGTISTAEVYQAATEGDALALAVTCRAGRYLAQAVHALVMTCDLERVVFGGGVARAGAAFLAPIEEELERLRSASPLAAEVLPLGLVGLVPADCEAALWGAVEVAARPASPPGPLS